MENNKKRAAGSGTTSGPRRERRQAIQWSALQQADQPVSSPAEMEKQLAALKKATESAEKQLKSLKKPTSKPKGLPAGLASMALGQKRLQRP